MPRMTHGGGLASAAGKPLTEPETTRILLCWLSLACAMLCCSCSTVAPATVITAVPDNATLPAEPRGIVGEVCPPALAAKGYC